MPTLQDAPRVSERYADHTVSTGCATLEPQSGQGRIAGGRLCDVTVDRWWVLHTRSRHEKTIAAVLAKQRIPHYLPLVRTQRTYGARRVNVELPLFPGYLFLGGGVYECDAAWRTNGVAQILRVDDQAKLRKELDDIRRAVESGLPVDLYPALRKGCRCRIRSGPLRGVEGVVVRRRSTSRMHIEATVLGQSAVIEIDAAILESIE